MMSSSFAVACKQLHEWGIGLSEQRIERLTYCFGRAGVALTEQWMSDLEQGHLAVGDTLRGQRVGLNIDGGRTRLRRNKKASAKPMASEAITETGENPNCSPCMPSMMKATA
ncbi:MAG: hypothetical protein HC768_09540 [Acaryochloris sp. CRU_2_0]|nr:hypothetical protein [Acaryochloris sp. CRU_2_0]